MVKNSLLVFVKGAIPDNRREEFEAMFAYLKEQPLPPGMLRCTLIQGACKSSKKAKTTEYTIISNWTSKEAFERNLRIHRILRAVSLFRKMKVSPSVEITEIVDTLP